MAGKQNLSIYDDRSTIGTPEELDEYGVWVKSEPEDLLSDVSLPETEELPDFDSLAEDFSDHSAGGFEDGADIENSFAVTKGPPGVSSPGAADLSTQLLMRIADELSSIKKELSSLKTELSSVKNAHQERPETHKKPGFFEEEDDEKIALTGDELNNILTTTSLTEPEAAANADFAVSDAADFAESETEDPLLDDILAVEDETVLPDGGFSTDDAPHQDDAVEIRADETDVLDVDGLDLQMNDDAGIEERNSAGLEKTSDEFDISFDLTSNFDLTEALDAPLNAKNLDSFQNDEISTADFELMEEPAPSGKGPGQVSPQEDAAYLEETPPALFSGGAASGEELDLSGAVIEEPDLSDSITENPLEEPAFDGISFEDDSLDGISIDMDMEEETAGQEGDTSIEDSFNVDAEDLIEIPFLDSLLAEPASEPQENKTPAPEDDPSNDSLADAVLDDGLSLSTEDDDISFAEYLGLDGEMENLSEPEPSVSSAMNLETENPLEELIPELAEEPFERGFEASPQAASAEVEAIPPNLKKELKTVLSYMDQLLESLPEEKIEEFAKSEYFDTYKRLFEELGIV